MLAPFLAALTWVAVGAYPAASLDMAPTARLRALPDSVLTITRLQYEGGGDWYANPSSLPNLLAAIRERTACRGRLNRRRSALSIRRSRITPTCT